jgi:hypothetical protein
MMRKGDENDVLEEFYSKFGAGKEAFPKIARTKAENRVHKLKSENKTPYLRITRRKHEC